MFDFLIVDDEVWVARLLSQIIDWEKEGFRLVGICNDSSEAIEMIAEKKPHLVLTDIKMPGMTGLELIEKAHKYCEETQFVIVSGYNDFSYAKEAIGLRAVGYLLKPVDEKELLKVVRYIFNQLSIVAEKRRQSSDMENIYLQAKEFRKKRLLMDLVRGNIAQNEVEYQSVFNGKENDEYFLATVFIEDPNDIKSAEAAFNTSLEINMTRNYVCSDVFDDHLIVVLFSCNAKESSMMQDQLETEFYRLIDKGGYKAVLGVGRTVSKLENLHDSYTDARNLLVLRWVRPEKSVFIHVPDQSSFTLISSICSQRVEIELLQATKAYDETSVERIIRNVIGQACRWSEKDPRVLPATIEWISNLISKEVTIQNGKKQMEAVQIEEEIGNVFYARNADSACIVLKNCLCKVFFRNSDQIYKDNNDMVEKARAFIDTHYIQDIGLNDVADAVHLNPNYFSTLFKQETGKSFKEYLTNKRVDKAKHYLKDSQFSVNEISNAVGYNEVKTFLQIFKKNVGITPSDYRKLMTKNGK